MTQYIDKSALVAETKPLFNVGDIIRNKQWKTATHKIVSMDDKAYYLENGGKVEIAYQELWEVVGEHANNNLQEVPCNHCQGYDNKEKCDELVFGYNCPVVKKPISVWHDSNKEQPNYASTVAIWNPKYKNGEIISRCTEVYSDRIWAYIDDLLKM